MLHGRVLLRVLLLSFLTLALLSYSWLAFDTTPSLSLPTPTSTAKPDRAYFPPTPNLCDDSPNFETICDSFPHDLLDVQITIKTGVGERPLLEALLNSYASCIPNIIIVSDASYTAQGHEVHDILADLPRTYADNNTDWAAYDEQREGLDAGRQIQKNHGGWKLDRFKFLPMVEYTYSQRPNAKWYVFIETDTYLFWDTLFRLLDRLDPNERHYLGAAVVGAWDRWFAYGGAGFVLSQGLLGNLTLSGDQRLSVKHEAMVREDCCGDAVLAYVLYAELGARIGTMYPTFSGDEPQWTGVRQEKWCAPLLSLHRVKAEQMESLWRWERCRALTEQAVTFAAFLDWSLSPLLVNGTTTRSHWNNGANIEQWWPLSRSAATCFAACERSRTCLQASYSDGKCRFGKKLKAGQATETDIQSSWDSKKLKRLGWLPGFKESSSLCSETIRLTPEIMLPPKDWAQYFGWKEWPEAVPGGSSNGPRQ